MPLPPSKFVAPGVTRSDHGNFRCVQQAFLLAASVAGLPIIGSSHGHQPLIADPQRFE